MKPHRARPLSADEIVEVVLTQTREAREVIFASAKLGLDMSSIPESIWGLAGGNRKRARKAPKR